MKILWVTTFRSFGISNKNDNLQKKFIKNLQKLKCKITLSVTIFKEQNIKKNVNVKGINAIFFKNTKKLHHNSKYSQSICMKNAMKLFDESYDCIIWSTADISIPRNLINKIRSYKEKNILMTVFPMYYVSSKNQISSYSSNWGLDLFILKISSKEKVKKLKRIINECPNFGWGCYEHFFSSISDALNIKYINICKNLIIKKYNNDRNAFNDFRNNEIISWKINQRYLLNYLKKNNLNNLFAKGSMYYLIYKFFNFKEMNFRLIIIYFKIVFKLPIVLIRLLYRKIFYL
jgi:hypothetical protein